MYYLHCMLSIAQPTHRIYCMHLPYTQGFPHRSVGKESACDAEDTGDAGWIPGSGRSPGEGNDNPLQYSCLENPMAEEPDGLQSIGMLGGGHD